MSECTHNCETCGADCSNREAESLIAPINKDSSVKKVIAVVSGKGGVGKSMVTSLMAVLMQRRDYKTAILDADITGPSIPQAFGLKEKAQATEDSLLPVKSKMGTEIMSVNLLLQNSSDPVIWRGPILAGTVKQFWTDVIWGDVDYMFVDMPPGTGDVPLTVFQSLPIDGIIVVASPQELVSMIVEKALKMAEMMNVPVIGLVENMSYFECPDCKKQHKIFGDSHIDEIAKKHGIDLVCKLPIDNKLAAGCDRGTIELFEGSWLDEIANCVENL